MDIVIMGFKLMAGATLFDFLFSLVSLFLVDLISKSKEK